jgi:hypothetical protein
MRAYALPFLFLWLWVDVECLCPPNKPTSTKTLLVVSDLPTAHHVLASILGHTYCVAYEKGTDKPSKVMSWFESQRRRTDVEAAVASMSIEVLN